jgi:hypothetical protein
LTVATTTDFARAVSETQQQAFSAWKNAVEQSFELGAQLLSLQKEYTLRAADLVAARTPQGQ